jgi:hypothetical protein
MEDETYMSRKEKGDVCLRAMISSFGDVSTKNLVTRACKENRRENLGLKRGDWKMSIPLYHPPLCLKPL